MSKYIYHSEPIVNICFLKLEKSAYLVTIGQDRMYVKYDYSTKEKDSLEIILDTRLEQVAKITTAELLPAEVLALNTSEHGQVILTANDCYKIAFYDAFSAVNLFTFLGPVFESPLKQVLVSRFCIWLNNC